MNFTVSFETSTRIKADTAIVLIHGSGKLSHAAEDLDQDLQGLITHAISGAPVFKGKPGQSLVVTAPAASGYARIILAGIGDPASLSLDDAEVAGGKLMGSVRSCGWKNAVLMSDLSQQQTAAILSGMALRAYRFEKYRSPPAKIEDRPVRLEQLEVVMDSVSGMEAAFAIRKAQIDGVYFARDLVNEPPNELYPESFAARIADELKPLGIEVEILDEKRMQKLGFGAHLAVGMGSARLPRVVIMRWKGAGGKKDDKPLAFVGKGVTFDTGGISIKPSANMDEMKMDMGGAAAVVGLMRSLAARKSTADVVGIVGLAENMPSDRAYRPGDIITSLAGKTIEVLNTDAEGRLVLADALSYVQRTYDPKLVVDLATLTGAIMVALGYEYAGAFANQDDVWDKLQAASRASGEKLWRMPLDTAYRKEMESAVADLKNLGSLGRFGGSCAAAGFLEHFVDEGRAWVHLDIAGTAWVGSDQPLAPKHATGFGVRVLDRLVADHYER